MILKIEFVQMMNGDNETVCPDIPEHTPVTRRMAAKLLHERMIELGIKDHFDWSEAKQLKDLFDCNTCVAHVAQVYLRGLLEARETVVDGQKLLLFAGEELLSTEEAENAAGRLKKLWERTTEEKAEVLGGGEVPSSSEIRSNFAATSRSAVPLSYQEAMELREKSSEAVLVDVRTKAEYEQDHLAGARSLPMAELLMNPYLLKAPKETICFLYCEGGYQSEIAANCLIENGFQTIYYFGLKERGDT